MKNMVDSFIDIIDSFLITLEKERNFSLHTIKAYKNDLIRFKLFLIKDKSRIVFKQINRNDIRNFLADEYEIIDYDYDHDHDHDQDCDGHDSYDDSYSSPLTSYRSSCSFCSLLPLMPRLHLLFVSMCQRQYMLRYIV